MTIPQPRTGSGPAAVRGEGRLRLQLLRFFELRCAGTPVDVLESVQRLVACLAVSHRQQRRLAIAGALWTDAPEERACANLLGGAG